VANRIWPIEEHRRSKDSAQLQKRIAYYSGNIRGGGGNYSCNKIRITHPDEESLLTI
jgi:hypothetical protein